MNYFGCVSYDGKAYWGFEKQKEYPSIQGSLEKALSQLCGRCIVIHGAGRTDKGVSAKGQTFTFKAHRQIENLDQFLTALNRLLPKDIYVLSLKEVADSFDARHSCCGKIYSYSFHYGPRDVFAPIEYQLEIPGFSLDRMKECLNLYLGKHNFKNFTSKPIDVDHYIRTIQEIRVEENKGHVKVFFKANGFMTYQVRIMMGAALRVALGRMSLEEVKIALDSEKRKILSYKADPIGLMLEEVLYAE